MIENDRRVLRGVKGGWRWLERESMGRLSPNSSKTDKNSPNSSKYNEMSDPSNCCKVSLESNGVVCGWIWDQLVVRER